MRRVWPNERQIKLNSQNSNIFKMIPYHGYESTTLAHHPTYNTGPNNQEQTETPKYQI